MSILQDDSERLRIRDSALAVLLSQTGRDPSSGMPSLAAQTMTLTSYPVFAQQFFACSPLTVLGPEVEGGIGIINPEASTFFALNLGSTVPPVGTRILVTLIESRWVFRYDG